MTLDELLAASKRGDPGANRALADRLFEVLERFFRRRVARDEVEDLVQSALVVIVRELEGFVPRHPRAFASFVGSVAHRLLVTRRRSIARERARRVFGSPPLDAPTSTRLSEQVALREQARRASAALVTLDSPQRRAVLDYLAGVHWQAQAATEGVAKPTLRSRLARAIVRLRREIDRAPIPATSR